MKKCGHIVVKAAVLFLFSVCICLSGGYAQETAVVSSQATLDNLMAAHNIETNANARYLAFARKANVEGYDVAAGLFRTIALAKQVNCEHYAELIEKLKGEPKADIEDFAIGGTQDNLASALKAETHKKNAVYPAFLKEAEKENVEEAVSVFKNAIAVENVYVELFARMLNNMSLSKGLAKDFYVCPVCGNIMDAVTVSMCPICSTDTKRFKRVR